MLITNLVLITCSVQVFHKSFPKTRFAPASHMIFHFYQSKSNFINIDNLMYCCKSHERLTRTIESVHINDWTMINLAIHLRKKKNVAHHNLGIFSHKNGKSTPFEETHRWFSSTICVNSDT